MIYWFFRGQPRSHPCVINIGKGGKSVCDNSVVVNNNSGEQIEAKNEDLCDLHIKVASMFICTSPPNKLIKSETKCLKATQRKTTCFSDQKE